MASVYACTSYCSDPILESEHVYLAMAEVEFGSNPPYYVYNESGLLEIPAICVVRDYNYAYPISEQQMRGLVDSGWTRCFDSCAVLKDKSLKSRSVVVVQNALENNQVEYFWFVRITIETAVSQFELDNVGRTILWAIPPVYAVKARQRWQQCPEVANSRLVRDFQPSHRPFESSFLKQVKVVKTADSETLHMLRLIVPSPFPRWRFGTWPHPRCADSKTRLSNAIAARKGTSEVHPRYKSFKTVHSFEHRMHACGASKSTVVAEVTQLRICFCASTGVGFPMLNEDEQRLIFEMVVRESLDGTDVDALNLLVAVRGVCKLAYETAGILANTLLRTMTASIIHANQEPTVARTLKVRDLFVPRGLSSAWMQRRHWQYLCSSSFWDNAFGGFWFLCMRAKIETNLPRASEMHARRAKRLDTVDCFRIRKSTRLQSERSHSLGCPIPELHSVRITMLLPPTRVVTDVHIHGAGAPPELPESYTHRTTRSGRCF